MTGEELRKMWEDLYERVMGGKPGTEADYGWQADCLLKGQGIHPTLATAQDWQDAADYLSKC